MTDQVAEVEDDEHDWYLELLAKLGRSEEHDQRVAAHEAGHVLVNRIIGACSISEVTINPTDAFDGLCRGARSEAYVANGVTAVDAIDGAAVRKILEPTMPREGESRDGKADVFQAVLDQCVELMAGEAAETLLLGGPASFAAHDRQQVADLAALIYCKTPQAIERFVQFCLQQAIDALREHALALMSFSIVLKIRRTMTGDEIDRAIATVLAGEAAAVELIRRKQWQRTIANAATFQAE
jgi:hypothetical protein